MGLLKWVFAFLVLGNILESCVGMSVWKDDFHHDNKDDDGYNWNTEQKDDIKINNGSEPSQEYYNTWNDKETEEDWAVKKEPYTKSMENDKMNYNGWAKGSEQWPAGTEEWMNNYYPHERKETVETSSYSEDSGESSEDFAENFVKGGISNLAGDMFGEMGGGADQVEINVSGFKMETGRAAGGSSEGGSPGQTSNITSYGKVNATSTLIKDTGNQGNYAESLKISIDTVNVKISGLEFGTKGGMKNVGKLGGHSTEGKEEAKDKWYGAFKKLMKNKKKN